MTTPRETGFPRKRTTSIESCVTLRAACAFLAIATVPGAVAAAPPICRGAPPTVQLPPTCVGEPAAGSATFCFEGNGACSGSGVVFGVTAPAAPFGISGLRIEGPNGARAVGATDFPIFLDTGDTLIADLLVVPTSAGPLNGQLGWTVALVGKRDCTVNVVAGTPVCAGPTPDNPCVGQVCAAGACVPGAVGGACEDGDPCTVGDTCADGVCRPGVPKDCSADLCAPGGTCVGGVCVGGTPPSCDDGNPCTADSCDPAVGCVHVASNAGCDDRNPCTSDLCDPIAGCLHVAVSGVACDDGDACTTDDRCTNGVCGGHAITCPPDRFACTVDHCVAGSCRHDPDDTQCGSAECTIGVCRPNDPAADRRGCIVTPVAEGDVCTDDGVACTDDVCTDGGCLHVPVDDRCEAADECRPAVCAPERPDRDAGGCVPAPVTDLAGTACAEDGDPCTDDVCDQGRCAHESVAEAASCAVVGGAFRKALGLAGLARTLAAALDGLEPATTPAGRSGMAAAQDRLAHIAGDLDGAVRALSGKMPVAADTTPIAQTIAQQRAHIAFTQILRTPQQVRGFLATLTEARARAAVGRASARTLRGRGRLLLRGTKTLKGELKRLQQVSQTFAR